MSLKNPEEKTLKKSLKTGRMTLKKGDNKIRFVTGQICVHNHGTCACLQADDNNFIYKHQNYPA